VKITIQLALDSFDTASPLRCKGAPGQNACKMNCLPCVHAERKVGGIFCSRFSRPVPNGQKYSLKEWRSSRVSILERDGKRCVICDREEGLHIHHIDRDITNDAPSNLITLCNFCHARTHAELHRAGGKTRVQWVINYYRSLRDGCAKES